MLKLEESQLRQMLNSAAELGAKSALIAAGIVKTEISKAEAYRRFSRKSVDKWINKGNLMPIKRGSSSKLNVMELESLVKTNQLVRTHLKTAS
jgi:hypothetical protein